ncbi:MAG TPA: peptide MFS transporter [Candidatus Obscuribacterales bacterium]
MSTTTAAYPPQMETDASLDRSGLFGHPRGLTTLFFTELWERFSYYGMRAILVLYMVAPPAQGGLGFDTRLAATIYGVYTMSVYLTSIPGGLIADRLLGARLCILLGGIIIACGHFTLAFPSLFAFYGGLLLIVLGTGLLKPNISSMLGTLYGKDDDRRDGGFSIFYMGINIGAALSPLVCGYLAQSPQFKGWLQSIGMDPNASWHFGFAAAGVGMIIGLTHYLAQYNHIVNAGNKPLERKTERAANEPPLTIEEWKRVGAIACLFVFNILFWAVYEQGGSSLNLFADKLTRNEILGIEFPSSWFQSVPAVYCIVLAPVFSWLWIAMGKKQPSSPAKFSIGLFLLAAGIALMVPASLLAASGKVSPMWLVVAYFLQVVGEMCLSPVGLSTVTKLAPQRFQSSTMGLWMVGMGLGNLLAGFMAGFFDETNTNALIGLFGFMGVFTCAAAAVLYLLTPTVRKLMSGVK